MRVLVKLLGFFFWLFSLNCQDGGVTATGNTEEGSYGDVIHFECVSIDKKIDRSSDIHCTETGELSDSVPKCKEITCTAPDISNGYVIEKMQEYQKDAILKYRCSPGFKPREGIPRCAKFGWTLNPECDEATCPLNTTVEELKMERFPDIEGSVKPGHKLIFSCNGQGLKLKGQSEITCQTNGEWSSPFPKCEDVMCVENLTVNMRSDGPPGPKVSIRHGHTITISCVGKGVKLLGQRKITCLPTGEWNVPFPKCVGGKCGRPPQVDSADTREYMTKTEYNSGETVEYICFHKYTVDERHPYSKYLTCEQGEWRGNIKCLKPCSVSVEEMDKRGIKLRWGAQQKIFSSHQERIVFVCQWGKKLIGSDNLLIQHCNDGEMNLPECV